MSARVFEPPSVMHAHVACPCSSSSPFCFGSVVFHVCSGMVAAVGEAKTEN